MEVWIRPNDEEFEIGKEGPQGLTLGRHTCKMAPEGGGEGITTFVSAQHCVLRLVDGTLRLADLKSTNGTFLCTPVTTTGFDVRSALSAAPTPLGQATPESAIVQVQVGTENPVVLFIRRVTGPKLFNPGTEVQLDPAVHTLLLVGPQEQQGWVIGRFVPEGESGKYRLRLLTCKLVLVPVPPPMSDGETDAEATIDV